MERQVTRFHAPVASDKRLAMTLHYLAQRITFALLALMYGVGKSTAVRVVHDTIASLKQHMVNDFIRFPQGGELEKVMINFKHLSGGGLPQCVGAVSSTFMHMKKPALRGDSLKNCTAILVLACVNAHDMDYLHT